MNGDWTPLSSASSRTEHTCRSTGEKGCRGCRWFETRLYRRDGFLSDVMLTMPDGRHVAPDATTEYKLEIIGRSIVPGEVDRIRTEYTTSANAVVDFLALGEPGHRYVPKVSRRVLHEAADLDEAIGDALDDFDLISASSRHPFNG